jgi:phosphoribosyl-AMP cyclohydrolase
LKQGEGDRMTIVNGSSLKFDENTDLIPVIVQETDTLKVLMMAYANRQAVELTQETGFAHYWSRSRRELWRKGGTSGNIQKVNRILVDCDHDTLLYSVTQTGHACHTGEETCFHNTLK